MFEVRIQTRYNENTFFYTNVTTSPTFDQDLTRDEPYLIFATKDEEGNESIKFFPERVITFISITELKDENEKR